MRNVKKETARNAKKERVAAFFKRIFVRDFLLKLFAVVFAAVLWLLAAGF